jgi:hypothetical protein
MDSGVKEKNNQGNKTSAANKRMALTLLSIAIVFFASVFLKKIFLE